MKKEEFSHLESIIQKEHSNVAGIVINRDGKTIYERYFNSCTSESCLHVFSVTKSIVSILFGIAMDLGHINNLNQTILDFFPDYDVDSRNKTIEKITLKHILTMTSPYRYSVFPPYLKYFTSDDWVRFSLDILGGGRKIGKFKYTPLIGPDILSGILQSVTGKSVLDFANEYLFGPLDIRLRENVIFETKEDQISFNKSTNTQGWVADSKGTNSAGWGLTLSARDMAKMGQLILNRGVCKNHRIVSENWINAMTSVHSKWNKHNLSYGFLWWVVDEEKRIYAAMGDGGNIIYVDSSRNMVVSIASLFTYRAKDRIKFIQKHIENIL